MNSVLVIGYGNTLREDDGAGVRAAEIISQKYPEVNCRTLHQLTPELAEEIAGFNIVFFIDAQKNITRPYVLLIEPGIVTDQPRSHYFTPESLLSLSKQLYHHLPEKTYVVGIPAFQFELNEDLSASTKSAVDESVKLISNLLNEFFGLTS